MFTDDNTMPFGKHCGARLGDVPASYLLWLMDQEWISKWPYLEQYIHEKRSQLEVEAEEEKEKYYQQKHGGDF